MIFADKLIDLRKKNGWTQEELAEKMQVSRQSVSKWEGAQSIPDLEKILRLSQLFGVSTDYLIKDELELAEFTESSEDRPALRQVTMEEANEFLALSQQVAKSMAWGVVLCILSPVALLMLGVLAEAGWWSENLAGGLGSVVMLAMVSLAVATFIGIGGRMEPYAYLEKEVFETAYGVDGMVRERQRKLRGPFYQKIAAGAVLCILSPVPLMVTAGFTEADVPLVCALCALFCMVALGVYIMVAACVHWGAMRKLLQEGEYAREKKGRSKAGDLISGFYWSVVTAVFLAYSFLTNDWGRSWVIWPVAAVLYGAVMAVCSLFERK